MSWNCRGAATKQFKSTFSRFRRKFGVGVAAILEPRVSGDKALNIIRSLGFNNFIIADAHGYSGGIWVVWDPVDVNITLINKQDQFIHVWVEFPRKDGFFWTTVYASPQEENKRLLWEDLKHIGRTMNEPWLLSGDLNEICSISEKKGGCPADINKCRMFSDVLDACGVLDLGGSGSRFTWKGPKYSHLDRVFKRLDRAMANDLWRNCFEEADVLNLSRIFSDHYPVLVRLEKGDSCWRERPFRFMAIWQNDPRFSVFFKSNWDTSSELLSSLKSFTLAVKDWNKSVFGFILFRKNRVLARLDGIQKHMCLHNSWHLEDLETKLLRELSEILDLEEQIWY
ncbi:uncharacterized protein LOC133289818 [Gastrolobium bilobum]|uniref:uncharacterized protein LOC133289818 n=1 Tax=Gastrolobium bilobum TaxID=150636 RepID=UPI002AB259E6|nr:uncharacterized protein LOC133289818 [Gastrolobium bilobum]